MAKALKHQISKDLIEHLADLLFAQSAHFDKARFMALVLTDEWPALTLKQRIRQVAIALHQSLKGTYAEQLQLLLAVHQSFSGLFHFIFSDFVELYGVEDWQISIEALAEFTQNSTSEFAIRPFIIKYPKELDDQLQQWARSDNHHLRRLASEGVRPKLPWATQLPSIAQNPDRVKPIIRLLNNDSSRYVQKSVANLLNDLSKSKTKWVLSEIETWNLQQENSYWIARHALRTLLKQGDAKALNILGYPPVTHIKIASFSLDKIIKRGTKGEFSFSLVSDDVPLGLIRLEYALYFLRKKKTAYRKVFKISEMTINTKQRSWKRKHDFKEISTRTYYAGTHKFEIIVNGQVLLKSEFELID